MTASPQTESLAERYARLSREGTEPRGVDAALRTLDVLISALVLLVAMPVLALLTVVFLVTSGTPLFYRGLRVGRHGRIFHMFKFRTLRRDAETRLGPYYGEELCAEIPQYWQRLVIRPGMTGFAQMRVTREHSWAEKLAHDLEYIADRSVGLYLRVVVATAWRVVKQSAAAVWGLLRGGRH